MERRAVNPWTWQDQFAFVQANEVRGAERVLLVAGQASVDGEGRPLHPGDMRAQLGQALDNLETVLTYEGTSEVHQLTIGRALTGEAAFR